MAKRALLSVYDKTGIVDFARFLTDTGYSLLSTGGTFRVLAEAGLDVQEVSSYTGAPEILDGRVKTLHPKIHGGILGRRDVPSHVQTMEDHDMDPVSLVAVNLYPFFEKSSEDMDFSELVEFIDIGGPSMIRSAAKNHQHVLVASSPESYKPLMDEWNDTGIWSAQTRRRLAGEAFALTGAYDAAVSRAFLGDESAPDWLNSSYKKECTLRYGENPHQQAAWYIPSSAASYGALSSFTQHQGKELSFNNLRDLDGAWRAVNEYSRGACVGVKHAAPCGIALSESPLEAWLAARDGDPVSIFGGIVAFNRPVDAPAAESLCELFLEVIAAPGYTPEALEVFSAKKNLRVLTINRPPSDRWEALPVDGGICLQQVDTHDDSPDNWSCPTEVQPTARQMEDLVFAWKAVKHVKSNGIAIASSLRTLGMGSGQPNRVGAVKLALDGIDAQNAVLASDAFFPFDDAVKTAAAAGITAIIQPGGSVRDRDSIEACNQAGIAMVFTKTRHFRH